MFLIKSSVNPAWPHFLGVFTIILGCVFGLTRQIMTGWSDPIQCRALLDKGSWLDSKHRNWQPDGCMLHPYLEKEASSCLRSKEVIFIGDSVTRKLFFQLSRLLDPSLPNSPSDDTRKHSDHTFYTKHGTNLTFTWDPFLNTSYTQWILAESRSHEVTRGDLPPPAMLVLGSGLWYLRYANSSGGISSWESKMDEIFDKLASNPKPADEVVILPVEQVVGSKLSTERASSMHASDIDAMNSDLYHRINPPSKDFKHAFSSLSSPPSISLPLVFNQMLHESLTEDGLHFSDTLIKIQANILLNLRCNDRLPKTFPLNKTCCSRYPWPSVLHLILIAAVVLSGPYMLYKTYSLGSARFASVLLDPKALPPLVISIAIALIYTADRSGFWLKEQKQFEPWTFGILCMLCLFIGLATVKRGDKDMGFLNRDQTDEWKGWMQIAILIYHYFGGSKISGIYNPIRILVASYLFMTGYGHTSFYLRKADFGFLRVAQVLIRLNLFTILLAYTMNTDYISYYFTPLVSMWYIIIYVTMVIGARFNDRTPLLVCKILLSAVFMTWFMKSNWPLESLFDVLNRICGIHWSPREWGFRVNLDLWIVYVGMLASIAMIKIREHRLTDHRHWTTAVKASIGLSVIVLIWFFVFELLQESKFTYNLWHPYISFLPILAFAVLRNSSIVLRSGTSRAFAFIGKCSLETFIIQFHFWLAADSKGVLLVVPGTRWRPVNFIITTIMFIYLCDRVAHATGELTTRICGTGTPRALPLPVTAPTINVPDETPSADSQELTIPLMGLRKDDAGSPLSLEPDTPVRPRRWVERLAEDSTLPPRGVGLRGWVAKFGWTPGLKTAIVLSIGLLWVLNVLWVYPEEVTS
ncbi:O-acetyltransferase [Crassisporium funariophilum]|nr:O-acetyltransferase [Crassisporium funariophilum]